MFSKITIGWIVGLLLFPLLALGVHLPSTMTGDAVTETVMLVIGLFTIVARFKHGDPVFEGKPWWQSKVLITSAVAVVFSGLALFNVIPSISQPAVVNGVLGIASVAGLVFGATTTRPIA